MRPFNRLWVETVIDQKIVNPSRVSGEPFTRFSRDLFGYRCSQSDLFIHAATTLQLSARPPCQWELLTEKQASAANTKEPPHAGILSWWLTFSEKPAPNR